MKRAVLYLRVSTLDQTTANQERERGGAGEFAEVSTEQLVSELRDLGIEVKVH